MKHQKVPILISSIYLALMLVALSFVEACAKPAPPAPTPAKHAPVEVELRNNLLGSQNYFVGVRLEEMSKRYSDWLTLMNKVGSSGGNIPDLANQPELRKKIISVGTEWNNIEAIKGMPPVKQPYSGGRAILLISTTVNGWITLDPNIKTMQDFVGKRVGVFAKGSGSATQTTWTLNVMGILDKVHLNYSNPGPLVDALRDKVMDVIIGVTVTDGVAWYLHPNYVELVSTKKWYAVDFPVKSLLKDFPEAKGWPLDTMVVPKGAISGLEKDWEGKSMGVGWWVDESMPDDIVTEVLRIVYEHTNEYASSHPNQNYFRRQDMAGFYLDEKLFHPAAVRFYKEKGVPIGRR